MSRRPGIGLVALPALVEALSTREGSMFIAQNRDVPSAIQIGGRLMPLGQYLRTRLRLVLFGESSQPTAAKELHERQFYATRMPFVPSDASPTLRKIASAFFYQQAKETHTQHVQTLEAKAHKAQWRQDFSHSRRKL